MPRNISDIRRRPSGRRPGLSLAALALVVASPGLAGAGDPGVDFYPFEDASVRFEQNATDGDAEVVFEITGGYDGLERLTVVGPDGRTVADFTAPDRSTLGMRHFTFESPEPTGVEPLRAAYPEGTYTFSGVTASGDLFHGETELAHELPATVSIIHPEPDAEDVLVEGLEIVWAPADGATGYILEIEHEDLPTAFVATLPPSVTSLSVPDGFLAPGTEYDLGIGAVKDGNISFVETSFTTAE